MLSLVRHEGQEKSAYSAIGADRPTAPGPVDRRASGKPSSAETARQSVDLAECRVTVAAVGLILDRQAALSNHKGLSLSPDHQHRRRRQRSGAAGYWLCAAVYRLERR